MNNVVESAPVTDSAPVPRRKRRGFVGRVYECRWDYMYIAPALIVMLLVIAYPIYYTFALSFYKTPPSLAMS